ncbi:hypothetical protein ANN_17593 [Periplaneta americana]|uniref:Uncharacterized protein n=1 Tax=Periplaneta americana TaxID=6978 RepID=A0ABQ8SUD7_PERAM|nr:hypothetical protein ANN_17593 [Periplaneta americana]
MIPGSNTESYPAFAHIGLRKTPEKISTSEDRQRTSLRSTNIVGVCLPGINLAIIAAKAIVKLQSTHRVSTTATKQEAALKEERQQKRNEVPNDFYATHAMTDRSWTGPNNEIRSAVTRLAVHGYHHKLCRRSNYHDPSPECVCKLCDKPCARYHFSECLKRKSLLEYSRAQN